MLRPSYKKVIMLTKKQHSFSTVAALLLFAIFADGKQCHHIVCSNEAMRLHASAVRLAGAAAGCRLGAVEVSSTVENKPDGTCREIHLFGPGCPFRVSCDRTSTSNWSLERVFGNLRRSREERDAEARSSCTCSVQKYGRRNEYAIIVSGEACGYYGINYGRPGHYNSPGPRREKKLKHDTAFQQGALLTHYYLTQHLNWPHERIIVFGCSKVVTSSSSHKYQYMKSPLQFPDGRPYQMQSDYSGPCANRDILKRVLAGEFEGEAGICSGCNKNDNGSGTWPDGKWNPDEECGCSHCDGSKRPEADSPKIFYFRGHGGHTSGKDPMTIITLPTFDSIKTQRADYFSEADMAIAIGLHAVSTAIIDSCHAGGLISPMLPEIFSSKKVVQPDVVVEFELANVIKYDIDPKGKIAFASVPEMCIAVRRTHLNPFTATLLHSGLMNRSKLTAYDVLDRVRDWARRTRASIPKMPMFADAPTRRMWSRLIGESHNDFIAPFAYGDEILLRELSEDLFASPRMEPSWITYSFPHESAYSRVVVGAAAAATEELAI